MNHKRGRPKNARAGCLLCKPHKANGFKNRSSCQTVQERRALVYDAEVQDVIIDEEERILDDDYEEEIEDWAWQCQP